MTTTLTNDQITAGAAVLCDHGQPIGRNAAIEVADAMRIAASSPQMMAELPEPFGSIEIGPGRTESVYSADQLRDAIAASRRAADGSDLTTCANCLRPKCEHNGKRCPSPFTTVWHAWDYEQAQPTYPEYATPAPASAGQAGQVAEVECRMCHGEEGAAGASGIWMTCPRCNGNGLQPVTERAAAPEDQPSAQVKP